MRKVLIIGPAHPLRGGLATFNHRLAEEFLRQGYDCSIVTFSLQYPSIFFPGKTQYSTDPAPEGLTIHPIINSINPLNWLKVGRRINKWKPDIIVVRFWLPLMGPSMGTILRIVRRNRHTRIVCNVDNIVPHEKRPGDNVFTRYFLAACDSFVTMSDKVMNDLRRFEKKKPALLVPHPLYDNLGALQTKDEARATLGLPQGDKIIMFFGFIRHYKGLDLLLRAMADERVKKEKIRLLVAGEFYENEKTYRELIDSLGIADSVILMNQFIPEYKVRHYFCAADCVVQPYRNATQSGVTPLSYHFERPMIVTDVGGLKLLVPHEKVGLVCDPEPPAIASAILRFYEMGEEHFIPHLRAEKQKYTWSNLTRAIEACAALGERSPQGR
jgi:glycosyltransferase involved in cell wall biosynthesis